jgi:hypothetical protein
MGVYQPPSSHLLACHRDHYDGSMPPMKKMTVRVSAVTEEMLEKLAAKYQIDVANVIRVAVSQMAERENIVLSKRNRS